MSLEYFHPVLQAWFRDTLGAPTAVQEAAWPDIRSGASVLIRAATGSGKTLAAWLPLIEGMIRKPASGPGVRVVYVSPLRALSRDMAANLAAPLGAFDTHAGVPRIGLRTGDTPAAERTAQRRRPPEMLITTPESLFVLLGSAGGRRMLGTVESVVVDEVHALAAGKRGAHLAVSLERLECLAGRLQRIGISATVRPGGDMAAFLTGPARACKIIGPGLTPAPDVVIELPDCPLGPFAHQLHWQQIHDRIAGLADHKATLVFCRTRGQVERTAAALAERLGEARVAAHHGSLDGELRGRVESAFKAGRIDVVVSSASLELGLDLGRVELVCQLGAPGSVNLFRQRAGRACHRPGERPRARLFPLTLNDLLEARSVVAALEVGEIEPTAICRAPVDVLCQQLVAMVAAGAGDPDALFALCRRAAPWAGLERAQFDAVVEMLDNGFVPGREGHRALVRRCAGPAGVVADESAGRVALINAGTIPEWFEYRVRLIDDEHHDGNSGGRDLGGLDEEFAFESSPGQILQLGNRSWRIVRIQPGTVWVEAALDQAANVPFWFGDGPGRSALVSARIRSAMDEAGDLASSRHDPLAEYLDRSRRILGRLPGRGRIVLERFFDPLGDQHLVIHSFAGARINRAWGLALRKRFCRRFNFELQAAATDDGVLISLGPTHSFEFPEILDYLNPATVEDVLVQALLDTPLFQTRFRWCATTALAIRRRSERGPVPAQIQRSQVENLIARVFPDQLACLENLLGPRQLPDHPLVRQAVADCIREHMDIGGLKRLLEAVRCGTLEVHSIDTPEPSPLAEALIHAPRHSFLDPAGAEQRRTRSFEDRKRAPTEVAGPPRAEHVVQHAWLGDTSVRGFEQGLRRAGYLLQVEGETGVSATGGRCPGGWARAFSALVRGRAALCFRPDSRRSLWAALDRLPELRAVWPDGEIRPWLPAGLARPPLDDPGEALARLLLGRIRVLGAVEPAHLAAETGLPAATVEQALTHLIGEGIVMRRDNHFIERSLAAAAAGKSGLKKQTAVNPD